MNKKRFAIVLSGCGRADGSEIHEAVSLLLAIDQQDCEYEFFAPDFPFQEKIGAVLSIIDNKITLNKRLSAKLEQMAKQHQLGLYMMP